MICKNTLGLIVTPLLLVHISWGETHPRQLLITSDTTHWSMTSIPRAINWLEEMHPKSNHYNHSQTKKGKLAFVSLFISKWYTRRGTSVVPIKRNITTEWQSTKGHFDLRRGLGYSPLIKITVLVLDWASQPADQSLYICNQQQLFHSLAMHSPTSRFFEPVVIFLATYKVSGKYVDFLVCEKYRKSLWEQKDKSWNKIQERRTSFLHRRC